jgi:N-acetylglucosaminyldiphosphoundecaprenol N-acetyl-beta-D-mannosaminyltransferase
MITSIVKTTEVLGIPITCFCSYDHATEFIVQRIRQRRQTFCVAINPEKVCAACRDASFGDLVRKGHIHICDGVGTAMAVRWIAGWRIPRITGVELFLALVEIAARARLRIFLLGAKAEVNQRAGAVLRARYPDLQIAGWHDGYFQDATEVIGQINDSGADMLFAALGSPRQERLLAEPLEKIRTPFCMGVGGSFDVLSGSVKRAPAFFRRTGTEFLYRLVREPRRWRRQSVLPGFAVRVLVEAVAVRGLKALVSSREIRTIYGAMEEAGEL